MKLEDVRKLIDDGVQDTVYSEHDPLVKIARKLLAVAEAAGRMPVKNWEGYRLIPTALDELIAAFAALEADP